MCVCVCVYVCALCVCVCVCNSLYTCAVTVRIKRHLPARTHATAEREMLGSSAKKSDGVIWMRKKV